MMVRFAQTLLLVACCVSSANAWSAKDACYALATIEDVNDSNNKFEISLGNTAIPNPQFYNGTSYTRQRESTMQFSLIEGIYNIRIVSKGCVGANTAAGEPDETQEIHVGTCNDVSVSAAGDLSQCNMYMVDKEKLTEMKNKLIDDEGSAYEPVISSLTLSNPRIDMKNDDESHLSSLISVSVIDFDRRENYGHHVDFKSDQQQYVTWSRNASFNSNDPNTTTGQLPDGGEDGAQGDDMNDVCSITDLSLEEAKLGSFPCAAYLGVAENTPGDTVFFNVGVTGTNDAGAESTSPYTVYGSIALEKTMDNSLTIKLTHQPKICDGYHEEVTCDGMSHLATNKMSSSGGYPGYTRGPSIVVNTTDRFQTKLGAAAKQNTSHDDFAQSDLLSATDKTGFDAYNAIRVPVNYADFDQDYASGLSNWRNQYVLMEAFVTDEDLAYADQQDSVDLNVTLTSRESPEHGGRTNPDCGRFIPINAAIQGYTNADGDTWDRDGPDAVDSNVWQNLNLEGGGVTPKSFTFDGTTHGRPVGDTRNAGLRRTRRFQWLWQPFYGLDMTDIVNNDQVDDRVDLEDWIGQQICSFDFIASDKSSVLGLPGLDDQDSNTVRRSFMIGTDPKTYAIADYAEPMPTFLGGAFWTSSPAPSTTLPMNFRFSRDTRCTVVGHTADSSVPSSQWTELQKYCWQIEKGYRVKFMIHDQGGGVASESEAQVRKQDGQSVQSENEYLYDQTDLDASNPIRMTVVFGEAAAGKIYTLYVLAYNENDKAGNGYYPTLTSKRWFLKKYDFTVATTPEFSGSFTPGTLDNVANDPYVGRKRRSLRSTIRGGPSTALALRGGKRGRRTLKEPLLAPGNPIRITAIGGDVQNGGLDAGIEISFEQTSLFSGKITNISASTGEKSVIATNDLLNRTAQLCAIIANGTSSAEVQIAELVAVYSELLGEMQAADKTTTSQMSRIMDKLRLNEDLTKEQSKTILAELKEEVNLMIDGTHTVLEVVQAETAMLQKMENTSSWAMLNQKDVWAYMINKMETFEDALAVIQYSAAEAKDYRFTESATMDAISTAQLTASTSTSADDDWFESAAGGTQITTLVLTGIMFIAGLVMVVFPKKFGKGGEGAGGYSLANNMNF
jgi:hypothetical protein